MGGDAGSPPGHKVPVVLEGLQRRPARQLLKVHLDPLQVADGEVEAGEGEAFDVGAHLPLEELQVEPVRLVLGGDEQLLGLGQEGQGGVEVLGEPLAGERLQLCVVVARAGEGGKFRAGSF